MRHYAKVLETNEETMAGFLSALRHVLRSIQELKRITQDERENAENIQDIEVCLLIKKKGRTVYNGKSIQYSYGDFLYNKTVSLCLQLFGTNEV